MAPCGTLFVLSFLSLAAAPALAFRPSPHGVRALTPRSGRPSPTQPRAATQTHMPESAADGDAAQPHCAHVLFVECGFGNDSHGQDVTKAAVRACRNAIEFNSIPSVARLVPGGYDNLKLDVLLAIPPRYQEGLDLAAVARVFPYGEARFTVQDGGMVAPSGIAIEALGDACEDMVVVCCAVTVGY